jgi:hypothetical protein
MEENPINEINKKLQNLIKRCEALEKENINNKKIIQINKVNILNLLEQQQRLRDEYKRQINDLQKYYSQQINKIYQAFSKNKNENEIIIENENNNNLFYSKKIKKEIDDSLEVKLQNFKSEIYFYVGQIATKEKENKKKEDIIKYKDKNIINQLENKLNNIFYDKSQEIPDKDIKELKKLGSIILIKHKQIPLDIAKSFIDNNLSKSKETNGIFKFNFDIKRGVILFQMGDISSEIIDKQNPSQFLKDFRDKYGIEDNDISENELKKIMKKYNNNEKKMIEAALKKLKYI